MKDAEGMEITLLAFGPLAEVLGWKRHKMTLQFSSKVEDVLEILAVHEWSERGLLLAINGQQCEKNVELNHGDELALLPPVSGG